MATAWAARGAPKTKIFEAMDGARMQARESLRDIPDKNMASVRECIDEYIVLKFFALAADRRADITGLVGRTQLLERLVRTRTPQEHQALAAQVMEQARGVTGAHGAVTDKGIDLYQHYGRIKAKAADALARATAGVGKDTDIAVLRDYINEYITLGMLTMLVGEAASEGLAQRSASILGMIESRTPGELAGVANRVMQQVNMALSAFDENYKAHAPEPSAGR